MLLLKTFKQARDPNPRLQSNDDAKGPLGPICEQGYSRGHGMKIQSQDTQLINPLHGAITCTTILSASASRARMALTRSQSMRPDRKTRHGTGEALVRPPTQCLSGSYELHGAPMAPIIHGDNLSLVLDPRLIHHLWRPQYGSNEVVTDWMQVFISLGANAATNKMMRRGGNSCHFRSFSRTSSSRISLATSDSHLVADHGGIDIHHLHHQVLAPGNSCHHHGAQLSVTEYEPYKRHAQLIRYSHG